ncbi:MULTISPECIES: DUF397 domain-containing protein [Streptomyces]|uniref:DUF397 domain-containing protein n=1 Tax=Streptomyces edwardsiae TaxID=3075527 RepID=A0ABU2QS87_9ACTN|nr:MULTISPECIES: DUF397 domain-containing protein [unclassified Streptomyces]MDT0406340.1 DUF397 domain-containing protein [Streptomyces sp. DSM 41635]
MTTAYAGVTTQLCWRKSSYSGSDGGDCVEVAPAFSTVYVRDSKNRALPSITVSAERWTAFVGFAAGR